MNTREILLADSRGIYIPKDFVEDFDMTQWGLDVGDPDVVCVAYGPHDNEWYWDAWNAILDKACMTVDGRKFYLHQDGDLWAVCWDEIADEVESARSFG